MTELQRKILASINVEGGVLWPRSDCSDVDLYAKGRDGRKHFKAPVKESFALYNAKLIDGNGVITDAGRAALTEETGGTT
jgi:hypothetical protein